MSTASVLRARWRASLLASLEYRADLIIGTLTNAAWLGFAVAPALIAFDHIDDALGWTLPQLLFVSATWYALDAMVWMWLIPNIHGWSEKVRSGDLDALLMRPIDSLTMASLGELRMDDVPKLVLAAGLGIGAALSGTGPPTVVALAGGLVAIVCGGVLLWAIAVLSNVKCLTSVRFDGTFVIHTGHNLARLPTAFYGPALRFALTAIVPVGFLTTVPAEVFFGRSSAWWAVVALALAAVAIAGTRAVWKSQLRHYAGAMG